jgi:hypothetical protein
MKSAAARDELILPLKNLLFTLIVPGTVAVYVPLILSRHRIGSSGLTFVIAILLFIIGGAIYAWCIFDFRVIWPRHSASP